MKIDEHHVIQYLVLSCCSKDYTQKDLSEDLNIPAPIISHLKNNKSDGKHIDSENCNKLINKLFTIKRIKSQLSLDGLKQFLRANHVDIPECNSDDEKQCIKYILEQGITNKFNPKSSEQEKSNYEKKYTLVNSGNFATDNTFIGRKEILDRIANCIDSAPVVLYGNGGIGKTTIALEYAERLKSRYSNRQMITFNGSYKDLINSIKLQDTNGISVNENIIECLRNSDVTNLLIFDNVDDTAEDINEFRNLIGTGDINAHIIITSRMEDENTFGSAEYIPIRELSEEEQIALFEKNYESELDCEELPVIKDILKIINGHTLFIKIIARTMKQGEDPSNLLKYLEQGMDSEITVDIKRPNHENAQGTMLKAFESLLVNTLDDQSGDKRLLKQLYLLPINGDKRISLTNLSELGGNINRLINHGWITQKGRRVLLHPVVREVIRGLKKLEQADYIEVLETMKKCAPDEETLCEIYYHLATILPAIPDEECANAKRYAFICMENYKYLFALTILLKTVDNIADDKVKIYNEIGDLFKRLADYNQAIKHYENALNLCESDVEKARIYRKIGEICRKQSKYDKALKFDESSLHIFIEAKKENPSILFDLAEAENAIGIVYLNKGDSEKDEAKKEEYYDKCKTCYINARKDWNKLIDQKIEGIDSKSIISKRNYTTHNLGTLYQRLGMYEKAIDKHKEALESRKKYKEKETEIAATEIQLANDYIQLLEQETDKKQKEEYCNIINDHLQKGREIRKKILGKDHPDYAWVLSAYVDYYCAIENYDLALKNIENVIRIRENKLGLKHEYTLRSKQKKQEISHFIK